jgi:hypothetical protein
VQIGTGYEGEGASVDDEDARAFLTGDVKPKAPPPKAVTAKAPAAKGKRGRK